MMLVEETSVPDEALPVEALKQHMRLGSGFAEDAVQDELLASFLRAALAAIEARTGKALVQRSFQVLVNAWDSPDRQPLPVAPVLSITQVSLTRPVMPDTDVEAVTILDGSGVTQVVDPARYRLEMESHTPCLRPRGGSLPTIATDGTAMIRLVAGMSPTFEGLPGDLAQAVLMLAAHFDEYRNEYGLSRGCMPFGVSSLIARYCPMRMGFTS